MYLRLITQSESRLLKPEEVLESTHTKTSLWRPKMQDLPGMALRIQIFFFFNIKGVKRRAFQSIRLSLGG